MLPVPKFQRQSQLQGGQKTWQRPFIKAFQTKSAEKIIFGRNLLMMTICVYLDIKLKICLHLSFYPKCRLRLCCFENFQSTHTCHNVFLSNCPKFETNNGKKSENTVLNLETIELEN